MFSNKETKAIFWHEIKKFAFKPKSTYDGQKFKFFKPTLFSFFTIKFEFLVQIFLLAFLRTSVLKASEALHIGRIAKITKLLRILYHLSKLSLDFG